MPSGIYQHRPRPPRTKSGMKGVIFCPHVKSVPYKAYIRHHGWYETIGYYATKEEAGRAYNVRAEKIYGDKAYLNRV